MDQFNDLVGAMKGQDSLSGWDVLVSYHEDQLNKLLAERAKTLNLTSPEAWESIDEDPITGDTRTIVFNVKLQQPTMKFVDTTNNIVVTMGLVGQYNVKGSDRKKSLPSGLTCELGTSLVNVAGGWHEDGWKPKPQRQTSGDSFIVVLEPGASEARGICIDLTECKAVLGETPGANIPPGTKAHLSPLIATFVEQHFAEHGLRLCLAAVSNHCDVNDRGSEVLQPQHFCFTVASGALMTWIGLKGGPNTGTRQSGKTSLSFAPGSSGISPIPDGSTASVIFSHSTMANLFLSRALKQSPDVDGVSCISVRAESGMKFSINFTSHPVTIDPEDTSHWSGFSYHVDGCTIDLNENACTLAIDGDTRPNKSHNAFNLSWSSNTKQIHASSHHAGAGRGSDRDTYSSCHATFSYKGTGQWRGTTDATNHPNQLGVEWVLDETLSMDIKADDRSFWDTINGKTGDIPKKYRDIRPAAPRLDIALKPLDYFLTTNLLLPGQHVFVADDPVPSSGDARTGLATPRDTILTGNVAANSVNSQKIWHVVREYQNFQAEVQE